MATTCSPTTRSSELPICAILISSMVSSGISDFSTATTARSFSSSVPLILAETALSTSASPSELLAIAWVSSSAPTTSLPAKHTVSVVAPDTTWLLVAMRSSLSFSPTIIPEPLPALWYCLVPYPKKLGISCTLTDVMATIEDMVAWATPATVPLSATISFTVESAELLSVLSSVPVTVSVFPIVVLLSFPLYLSAAIFTPWKTTPATSPKITASATAVAAFFPKLLWPEKSLFFRGFLGGIFPPA